MKEEITISFEDQTGFRISEGDVSTGKVVVNGIEITSVEDWEKVTKSISDLQSQLKAKEEVIKLCHYTNLQLLKAKDNLDKKDKLDWELK